MLLSLYTKQQSVRIQIYFAKHISIYFNFNSKQPLSTEAYLSESDFISKTLFLPTINFLFLSHDFDQT
jgi:hypothetical protein